MKFHVSLTTSLDGELSASFHGCYSPGKAVPVTAGYEEGWTQELIPARWWGEKSLPLLGNESRSCRPIVTDLRGKLPKSRSLDHQTLILCFTAEKFYE
jgi:hypothetical protein